MRVSRSGAWMSAGRPHSKRETSRASSFWISLARRSLERTICLPDSNRSLNVWKNSSWMRSLPARNWTSSRSMHVDVPVSLAELDHPVLLQGLDEVVGELLGREVGDPRVRVVPEDRVPDGVHQVGLARAPCPRR